MKTNELLALFPKASLQNKPSQDSQKISLRLDQQHWLVLATEDLTDREQQLLALLTEKESVFSQNPWYRYLASESEETLPHEVEALQFIHCHLFHYETESIAAWLDMMRTLLTNKVAYFQTSPQDYVFVLDQGQQLAVKELLRDVLSAVEYDFNLRLAVLIGQVWPKSVKDELPQLYRAESSLFTQWLNRYQQSLVIPFSQLFLWGLDEAKDSLLPLKRKLHQLIEGQEQLSEIIIALWENGAVVTKAAQQLYIHRNTLQYRLDKWEELTGLQLKELTDLSLCYQIILKDLF
ncbi:transcriptional regulator, Fis family [Streptococcus sp. oral taxon 056 str. F0418]|uniref:helix-turn-helix domain-containing protein n=1 Tax=Streptococcus sp. oral taxon 056 TaxID=712620 RepID=UPI00021812D1|nr:helix-turn-helix domain-containing protein [Streptococcus sp. oral taxon 056]EGP65741.1 transcriptional regulator, Fis family [Streptococcus sp. oral taxon 056 str. F0418]